MLANTALRISPLASAFHRDNRRWRRAGAGATPKRLLLSASANTVILAKRSVGRGASARVTTAATADGTFGFASLADGGTESTGRFMSVNRSPVNGNLPTSTS